MERIKFGIRVYGSDKERWQNLLKAFPGKTYELFRIAVDELEKKQGGSWEEISPMQRAQAALVNMGNALGELSAEIEKVESLKQRVQDLEAYIDSKDKQHSDRETELLGDIHRLREENKKLSIAHRDLEALRAKYDILMRDRTALRRRLKKLEADQE